MRLSLPIDFLPLSVGCVELGSSSSCPRLLQLVGLTMLSIRLCLPVASHGAFGSIAAAKNIIILMLGVLHLELITACVIDV